MTKISQFLETYKKHITDEFKSETGIDWASSAEKINAARLKLVAIVKIAHPNISPIRHEQFIMLMFPATPQTQYVGMTTQKINRPKKQAKPKERIHADYKARRKAEEIRKLVESYINSPYITCDNAIVNTALAFFYEQIKEIKTNAEGLPPKEVTQRIKLMLIS